MRAPITSLLLTVGVVVVLSVTSAQMPVLAGDLRVQDIRIGTSADGTRFVVELSESTEARIFGLPDPYRLVIDLPEVNFDLTEERIGDGAGLISKIRYGLFRPGTSRFVLDLGSPAKVAKQFLLRPEGGKPWRLVLDLQETTRAEFVALMRLSVPSATQSRREAPISEPSNSSGRARVVIDPGHGGVDPGAIGVSGAYEKDIALIYSRAIAQELRKTGRFDVELTRDRDIFLPLRDRLQHARTTGADLFLSFHANSHPKRSTRGVSVYTLSDRASDKEAALLAAHENKSDAISGVNLGNYSDDVQDILIDFARTKTNELSVKFARDILVDQIRPEAALLTRPWRSAGFTVLKAPDVPSVLVELGYISNPREERLLTSPGHREKMARAVTNAVIEYFSTIQKAAL